MKRLLLHSSPKRTTILVLYGSICVSVSLTILLILYDVFVSGQIRTRLFVGIAATLYLFIVWILIFKNHLTVGRWLLILLYGSAATFTLLIFGLNAAVGLFASSFVIILAGVLLGSKAILPVMISMGSVLLCVQTLHAHGIFKPDLTSLSKASDYFDAISYVTILGVFALVIWISNFQIEKSLSRAQAAEALTRSQKDAIAFELEIESARLRQAHFQEMQQLYKFATLGQSTAATLHELSNHLSILNMDIDDIKQVRQNSQAIKNAQDGIEHINSLIRQVRRRLDSYDSSRNFAIGMPIKKTLQDFNTKLKSRNITIKYSSNSLGARHIHGDPLALMQILTILLNNAVEACSELPNAHISITLSIKDGHLRLTVADNGVGINDLEEKQLFQPKQSIKPTGLGVGLYIAKLLTDSQFNASLYLEKNQPKANLGAQFTIVFP